MYAIFSVQWIPDVHGVEATTLFNSVTLGLARGIGRATHSVQRK